MNYPVDYEFGYTWFHEAEWKAGNRRSVCWARTIAMRRVVPCSSLLVGALARRVLERDLAEVRGRTSLRLALRAAPRPPRRPLPVVGSCHRLGFAEAAQPEDATPRSRAAAPHTSQTVKVGSSRR